MTQGTQDVFRILNLLERELSTKITGGGGEQSTEPYRHFEDSMNEIYDYVKFVFETNEKNKKEYKDSVVKMDKDCDCDANNYKADKNSSIKPSINNSSGNGPSGNDPSGNGPSGNGPSGNGPSGNGPSIVFTLKPPNRKDESIEGSDKKESYKIKDEWI